MGKDLKNKELGKGLSQEKSGYYLARFVDRYGKRQSKRFKKLQEARQWLADSIYIDEHSNSSMPSNMTVDSFFEFWIDTKQKMSKKGTAEVYKQRYYKTVQPVIGNMVISEVKANHCQMIINSMIEDNYGHETIAIARSLLNGLFDYAVECDVIMKSPSKIKLKKVVGKAKKLREALTIDEQKKFLDTISGHVHENQFKFVLQTGLRIGELMGLKWEDVDFKNKTIKISRSLHYDSKKKIWDKGNPKSQAGNRTIPLTKEAIEILKCQKLKNELLKVIPLEWNGYVFLNDSGVPIRYEGYTASLKRLCKKNGMRHFSMHVLRHTFATRCIEAGMKPKTLQTIMGHSSISVTMDLYVHTTDDELFNEIELVSKVLMVM